MQQLMHVYVQDFILIVMTIGFVSAFLALLFWAMLEPGFRTLVTWLSLLTRPIFWRFARYLVRRYPMPKRHKSLP